MSFLQKQTQIRLIRAQELLASTECKVVEIAFESGYQSLSLFNLMFKRRFGMTPAKWRSQTRDVNEPGIQSHRFRRSKLSHVIAEH
jgi:AraC-like DNA-binding protein